LTRHLIALAGEYRVLFEPQPDVERREDARLLDLSPASRRAVDVVTGTKLAETAISWSLTIKPL
jgi:hypothetical protein